MKTKQTHSLPTTDIRAVHPFPDGCLVLAFESSKNGGKTVGYFLDLASPDQRTQLADNFDQQQFRVIRLGNWFYYVTGDLNDRHRWKVSLDRPMEVIELDCPD